MTEANPQMREFVSQVCETAPQMSRIWMSHITLMNESRWWGKSFETTDERVRGSSLQNAPQMSSMWMSHVTLINDSRSWEKSFETTQVLMSNLRYKWFMSCVNESNDTFECVMSLIWNDERTATIPHTYSWVTSRMNEACHTWMSQVTHLQVTSLREEPRRHTQINESCHV